MAVEIERKFLLRDGDWRRAAEGPAASYRQGYLAITDHAVVRVRLAADARAWIGVKERRVGRARREFEYPIPGADAAQLLELALGTVIEKRRYRVPHAGKLWEIDEFSGANSGLVVAEIELADADEEFERPPWLGREVTEDPAYYNVALALRPWREWNPADAEV